ncbi:MAG: hypothetical protein RMY34_29275 [Aulosira sp. DedQUE10]|nr:hypothetical protein [Aulosira sp. DedQUE10]
MELEDLWQDFTTSNSSYRSLDRIGLSETRERVPGFSVLGRNTNLINISTQQILQHQIY